MDLLRAASRLAYLFSAGAPHALNCSRETTFERWRAFWEFVATHPPLRCLAYAPNLDFESQERQGSHLLVRALFMLNHRRPGLQLRQLAIAHDLNPKRMCFFNEIVHCTSILSGPGVAI